MKSPLWLEQAGPNVGTAPDSPDAVTWQAPVLDVALDEKSERLLVHGARRQ